MGRHRRPELSPEHRHHLPGLRGRHEHGGRTFRQGASGGYRAPRVAISPDGRVWAWFSGPGCSTSSACTSRLVTVLPGRSPVRTVLATGATVTGLVAGPGGRATVAVTLCTGRLSAPSQTCRGRVEGTTDAGAAWRTRWQGSAWVGGLAGTARGARWAVAAYGGPGYRLRAEAWVALSDGRPARCTAAP
jgi:hypothetical protein